MIAVQTATVHVDVEHLREDATLSSKAPLISRARHAPVAGARTYIFSAKSAVAAILAAARAKSAGEDRGT